MFDFHELESPTSLVETLSNKLTVHLSDRIAKTGKASVAVSGGTTPVPLFHAMRQVPIAWQCVNICLVDERWVPPTHARSNERLVRQELLADEAGAASFTGMWRSADEPVAALQDVERRYRQLPQPLDVVLLGMGSDGHTASLFPDAKGLDVAFDTTRPNICAAIEARRSDITGEETRRITLTARAISEARLTILLITGQDKRRVFEASHKTKGLAPIGRLTAILNRPLQVYWAPQGTTP